MEIKSYLDRVQINMSDMINNELAYYCDDKYSIYYTKYLKTANYVDDLFSKHNFDYCAIKAFRNYKHFNTDLNISVSSKDFKDIILLLESLGWSRRDWWSQFKENVSEYGKRKMVLLNSKEFCEIHLYPGLSWHGFEYWNHSQIMDNSLKCEIDGFSFQNTNIIGDIVCNIGHAIFERYKLTAGEIYFLDCTIKKLDAEQRKAIDNIFLDNGWGVSLVSIEKLIEINFGKCQSYPIQIPRSILKQAWLTRFVHYLKLFNPLAAILEYTFNIIWSGSLYKFYSFIKKSITGQNGIEKKYKDIL